MPHILILEDEPSIAESLIFVLQQESFSTHWETLAARALVYLQQQAVDLVIMDVGLPDMTGFEACKRLRQFSDLPVMFLTARSDELDRVVGLEIGADDYVVKPFSPREVAARVKAILKRYGTQQPTRVQDFPVLNAKEVAPGVFKVDIERKLIYYCQQPLQLTRLEFCLLQTLVAHQQRVFTRDQLMAAVGIATDAGYDRSIDGHIKALRIKLRAVNPTMDPIKTIRGFGYACQPAPG